MYKQQKKQYLNYIILSNGSSIKKNSFKNKRVESIKNAVEKLKLEENEQ